MWKKKCILLLAIILSIAGCTLNHNTNGFLKVHVIDVGQGDSILITTTSNKAVLIDGGEAQYGDKVVKYLRKQGVDRIHLLIATHPHADHIGGLIHVINSFDIDEILMPTVLHTSKTFENFILAIKNKNIKTTAARGGLEYSLDEDTTLRILGPLKEYGSNLNNWSVIGQLQHKNKLFLFAGDAEKEAEEDLLNHYSHHLNSHFLKVSHHGSKTSTNTDFLKTVNPDVAVISLGRDNPYGFPHKEVLDRLLENNIYVYRTDDHGTIVFISDGKKLWTKAKPHY